VAPLASQRPRCAATASRHRRNLRRR
jgi:hypothetical protein